MDRSAAVISGTESGWFFEDRVLRICTINENNDCRYIFASCSRFTVNWVALPVELSVNDSGALDGLVDEYDPVNVIDYSSF